MHKLLPLLLLAVLFSSGSALLPHRTVSVRDFGAKGDGRANDEPAIERALAVSDRVFFPAGQYLIKGHGDSRTDGINIHGSGKLLFGEGRNSVIIQDSSSMYGISINGYDGGSPNIRDNVRSVTISNITLEGQVRSSGFAEFHSLINANAVTDLKIVKCAFLGFRGDGLYIGSSNSHSLERHNCNVLVRECLFDGLNNDNRQCISVIDCDGCEISECIFMNSTRPNLPGAIDIEPDDHAFHIVDHILIARCSFRHIGGNAGVITLYFPPNLHRQQRSIRITGNIFLACQNGAITLNDNSTSMHADSAGYPSILITGNFASRCARSLGLFGVHGVVVARNVFSDTVGTSIIGYIHVKQECDRVYIYGNTFINNGCGANGGIAIFFARNIVIADNVFDEFGNGAPGSYAIALNSGTSHKLQITNNTFLSRKAPSCYAVFLSQDHRIDPAQTVLRGNRFQGLLVSSGLPADFGSH